jgi:predicted PP-loop superfamily ATPase
MNDFACSRCLLNTQVPGVTVSSNSVCSVCHEYDKLWGNWSEVKDERRKNLENILKKVRAKNRPYDVLVPISGGKDSIYVLYLCRSKYNLKCLAVTWDNGFLSDHARQNIAKACDELCVDHIYYGINKDLLMKLYRLFFIKTGFFCPVCLTGMSVAVMRAQTAFKIPLRISGTSRRTEEHVSPLFFLQGDSSFMENVLEGETIKTDASILLEPLGLFSSPPRLKLPDYIDWNYDEIYKTIKSKLGWKSHEEMAEHTDCKVDNIVNYVRYMKFPTLVPDMLRFSKLVTAGQMSREEAEDRVSEIKAKMQEPENLDWFLKTLKITKEEFDNVLSEPLRHMKYMKQRSRVLRRLRYLIK